MNKTPVYRVLTSLGGCVWRGEDREEAGRSYTAALREAEDRGEGSVLLLRESEVLERYEPRPAKRRQRALGWLRGWRREAQEP